MDTRRRARLARKVAATAVVLALPVLSADCGGATHHRASTGIRSPALDRLLTSYVDETNVAFGVIALVKTPSASWRGAAGSADLARRTALQTGDRFRAGSVTKTFTATVLLQLVAERKLALEDTLARRLPGAFPYGKRITLRQLLNHTSGIRDARDEEFPPMSAVIPLIRDPRLQAQAARLALRKAHGDDAAAPWQIWVAAASTQPLLSTPGSRFHYSNINYAVIGEIIERRTGQTLAQEIRRRILQPLHLEHTELATSTALSGAFAHGYVINLRGATDASTTADDARTALGSGYGAIVSTVGDLARFYSALLGGRLLPARQLAQMLTATATPPTWGDIPTTGYGLGQTHYALPCGEAWGHGGGLDGYLTQVLSDRHGRRIAVVAVNSTGGNSSAAKSDLAVDLYCRSNRTPAA